MEPALKFLTVAIILSCLHFSAVCQVKKYYPKGNPRQFQAEITVPLWIPWIKGEAGLDGLLHDLEGDINATPANLVSNLKGAVALNADVSKGGVIGFVNYMHIKLGTQNTLAQLPQGGTVNWNATIKNDILDIAAGGRMHFNKGMIDPFFGVRYYNLNASVDLNGGSLSKTGSRQVNFWAPMIGTRLFYYPKERVMLFLKTDFGGIWGGSSEFSWNIEGKAGYTISPTIDVAAGFRTYSFKYAEFANNARIFYMNPHMYGFELSASFLMPKRSSSNALFPKKKTGE